VLGLRDPDTDRRLAADILARRRDDGTWSNWWEGPADLSTTIEAYLALKLVGDPPDADHMARAARWVRTEGGVERARVFTHIWLSLFGLWSWDDVPAIPAELVLLPRWFPFNPYDFACWARQTIVALSVVSSHRPCRPLPFRIDELMTRQRQPPQIDPQARPGAGLQLARHVDLRGRVVTHQHDAETRRSARGPGERRDRWYELVANGGGDGGAVDDACAHGVF